MAESSSPSPQLKIHQVIQVSPPQESPKTTLPFTFFDVIWLRLPPVERLFFYEFPNITLTSFFDTILPSLKHSLSNTLQHFLPLLGTITWPLHSPFPLITYNPGNTIPFTIAQSNENHHLSSNLSQVQQRQNLIPHLANSHDQASVLALQLTLFPNHGFCIGITTHHAALDGKSSTLFMKAWAHLCSHLKDSPSPSLSPSPSQPLTLPKHLTPSFDRSMIKDPSAIGEAYANSWLNFGGGSNNRSVKVWESLHGETQNQMYKGLFELTPSNIRNLKKLAMSKGVGKNIKITSFTVTCAYVLKCMVRVDPPKGNRVAFVFIVDCRSRLDPQIPETYFGNCIQPQLVIVEKDLVLGDDGFVEGIMGISEVMNSIEGAVLSGAENWIQKIQGVVGDRFYSSAGSPRFEVYGVDFGWGRPKKVDVSSIDKTGAFSLAECRDLSGGIEIGLALNKTQMEEFSMVFNQGLEALE